MTSTDDMKPMLSAGCTGTDRAADTDGMRTDEDGTG
jgi:hypothetical protein